MNTYNGWSGRGPQTLTAGERLGQPDWLFRPKTRYIYKEVS